MAPYVHPLSKKYARAWDMDEALAAEWLRLEPITWAVNNARVLHAAGLTPLEAKDLFDRVDTKVAASMGRLVDAARMASLDTRHLHWWAASGLLRPVVAVTPGAAVPIPAMPGRARPGRPARMPGVSFTRWVTEARWFVSACGGDQALAALAAAAGLSVTETRARFAAGDLEQESLRMLVAFREARSPALGAD